jgi:sedoheptulokinase
MSKALLIDFGTSSIKSAIVDLKSGEFSFVQSHASGECCSALPRHYEVSPSQLRERFIAICDHYLTDLAIDYEGIVICSEKNGFVALDADNSPITNYISWKDERSLEELEGVDTFSLVVEGLGDQFWAITGWRPGPGLPYMNVTHLARQARIKGECKIVSLPEWLALCSGDSNDVVHDSMLHGLCFYDVRAKIVSETLVEWVEDLTGVRCRFNSVAPTGSISGYWHVAGRRIPIYIGIGDHQTSVLGAGNLPGETISVNIGTGSQVAVIDPEIVPREVELKPYFDSRDLVVVTRIPGGRALAGYVGFLGDVVRASGGTEADFWDMLYQLDETSILESSLKFDLATFGSAWNYQGGGKITNIGDGTFTLENYLASLLLSFTQQYVDLMRVFDPQHRISTCVLSGGVPRRIPVLNRLVQRMSGYETKPATEVDESLIGLRALAWVSLQPGTSCLDAQDMFGRKCHVR